MIRASSAAALLAACCLGVSGCTHLFSGSLRVEVDVYKGPLTKEVRSQRAEFVGLVTGIPGVLESLDTQHARSQCWLGCLQASGQPPYTPTAQQCVDMRMVQKSRKKDSCEDPLSLSCYVDRHSSEYRACHELKGLRIRIRALKALAGKLSTQAGTFTHSGQLTQNDLEVLEGALALAAGFRAAATEVSFQWAGAVRNSTTVRIDQVKYANAMAEMSNHLSSRADSLLKQEVAQIDREKLPTGIYLRDSAVTRYAQTYRWLDAAVGKKDISVEERTRIVEQLFSDGAWDRVNEVYASGTGKVSMAFVKDSIGNWNLKAFENDPTEMIESFREVGQASLKAAADLAAGGGAVSGVANRLAVANAAYFGETAAAVSVLPPGLSFAEQHEQFRAELAQIEARYNATGQKDLQARAEAFQSISHLVDKHAYLVKALQQALIFEADRQTDAKPQTPAPVNGEVQ